jgi:hypothetical protein
MSERLLKTLQESAAFQAEDDGSIPFTRSKAPISYEAFSLGATDGSCEQERCAAWGI